MKMWKVYRRQTDRQTDLRWSENLTSLEPSTQASLRIWNNVEKIVFLASSMGILQAKILLCVHVRESASVVLKEYNVFNVAKR